MYGAFFGLTKPPFGMAPDLDFMFLTPKHREAVAGLAYAVTERKGFLVLSGEAGTGKTTALNWVSRRLAERKVAISTILNPMLTSNELLEAVMLGFGIQDIPESRPRRLFKLAGFLRLESEKDSTSALIVDEAHKLAPELLEQIRLLGNFEQDGQKLLQILLIGQSEIDDLLGQPEMRQLKQRISVRLTIDPLCREELEHYIRHRWKKAGGAEPPFSTVVVDRIFHWSSGIPRLVNSLADNALMLAFADNKKSLDPAVIDCVAKDLQLKPPAKTDTIPQPPLEPKVAAPAVPCEVAAATATLASPLKLATLERYDAAERPAPFFVRWAGKLGLA